MTILPFRTEQERRVALPAVVAHLRADRLIAYPTETVYGLGGAAAPAAVAALQDLKGRDPTRPFLLLIRQPDQAPTMQWNDTARLLARHFWPGPLTIAVPAVAGLPAGIVSEDGLVAVRSSPHEGVQAIVDAFGAPVTSTSANAPGAAPAMSAAGVVAALEALGGRDVLVLDGGALPTSAPSTVVRCDDGRVHVLRAGAITVAELRDRLRESRIDVD